MSSYSQIVRGRRLMAALGAGVLVPLVAAVLPASAAPRRADLVVAATATRSVVPDVGGGVTVVVDVRNAGTKPVEDVTLTYALPPGAGFTDGNSPPEGWQCDFGARTCTYGGLAAGATAPQLQFSFYFPPATAGTTADVTVTAATTSTELSAANNVAEATINYVRGVTDIEVTRVQISLTQVIVGDTVDISVEVANTGNMTADQVYVTVPVPAGLTRFGEEVGGGWDCTFGDDPAGQPAWRCVRNQIVAGFTTTDDPLDLSATVTSDSPGDVVTVTATATTNAPEDDLSDNTAQASIAIVEPATVRGTVWQDADRDGIRDADESGVTGSDLRVFVSTGPGYQTTVPASVASDGSYLAQIRPGDIFVGSFISKPYCFTDSVDAPLGGFDNGYYSSQAWSNEFALPPGGEASVDAALVTC